MTNTEGQHTDVGVIEEVEKLTLKSDISTFKPTRIVTLDESAVVFEMLLRKTRLQSWKFVGGFIFVLTTPGLVLGMFIEQFAEWFIFGGLLLGSLVAVTVCTLINTTYDVTDGAGVNIGVVYEDAKASLLRKKWVIETQSGRWRLAETSSLQPLLRLTASFVTLCIFGVWAAFEWPYNDISDQGQGPNAVLRRVLTALEYSDISRTIGFVVIVITLVFIKLFFGKMIKKELLLTLTNESGVQVGTTKEADGSYDIQVLDSRLDWRVAAAAGLIAVDSTTA